MRINGFRCDTCSKEHSLNGTRDNMNPYQYLPQEWFTLQQGLLTPMSSEPLTFCSLRCLYQWSSNRLDANTGKVSE